MALGLGGVIAVDAGTGSAEAQGGFSVTPGQLQINQRISQAAVRRSNRSLNYLAPIRTTTTDGADDGRSGVAALSRVPGSGQGWTTAQIAGGAITGAKIAADAVGSAQIADGAVGRQQLTTEVRNQLDAAVSSADASTSGAYPGEPIPSGGTSQVVMSTADDSGGRRGTGPVAFGVPRRIVANGFVDVRNTGGANSTAVCFLGAQQGAGISTLTTPQGAITVPSLSTVRMPLAGTIERDPGTYDVVIYCRGGATVRIEEMTVNAVVADQ